LAPPLLIVLTYSGLVAILGSPLRLSNPPSLSSATLKRPPNQPATSPGINVSTLQSQLRYVSRTCRKRSPGSRWVTRREMQRIQTGIESWLSLRRSTDALEFAWRTLLLSRARKRTVPLSGWQNTFMRKALPVSLLHMCHSQFSSFISHSLPFLNSSPFLVLAVAVRRR
jgi:hypothetical protein